MPAQRACLARFRVAMILLIGAALLAGCGGQSSSQAADPPLPHGWTWYRDAKYPFQVPNPPQWTPAGFTSADASGNMTYTVYFYSPGRSVHRDDINPPEHEQRLIGVGLIVAGPTVAPPQAETGSFRWIPEDARITIDGVATTLYDRVDSAYPQGEVDRATNATFGGHQYVFYMQSTAEQSKADIALFMRMLQGFRYTGK